MKVLSDVFEFEHLKLILLKAIIFFKFNYTDSKHKLKDLCNNENIHQLLLVLFIRSQQESMKHIFFYLANDRDPLIIKEQKQSKKKPTKLETSHWISQCLLNIIQEKDRLHRLSANLSVLKINYK